MEERREGTKQILKFLQDLSYKIGGIDEKIVNIETKVLSIEKEISDNDFVQIKKFYIQHWKEKEEAKKLAKNSVIQGFATEAGKVLFTIAIIITLLVCTPIKNFIFAIREEKIEEIQKSDNNK